MNNRNRITVKQSHYLWSFGMEIIVDGKETKNGDIRWICYNTVDDAIDFLRRKYDIQTHIIPPYERGDKYQVHLLYARNTNIYWIYRSCYHKNIYVAKRMAISAAIKAIQNKKTKYIW